STVLLTPFHVPCECFLMSSFDNLHFFIYGDYCHLHGRKYSPMVDCPAVKKQKAAKPSMSLSLSLAIYK
ncbi:MAG: hypothetical protein FWE27_00770, partial [Defluviitaleaceae bacterium]|nr:hypothetical protein [Defluviitaleaceae bacterium]